MSQGKQIQHKTPLKAVCCIEKNLWKYSGVFFLLLLCKQQGGHILFSKVLERITPLQGLCVQEVKYKCSTASIIPHKVKNAKTKAQSQNA